MSPKVGPMDGLCNYMHARSIVPRFKNPPPIFLFCTPYPVEIVPLTLSFLDYFVSVRSRRLRRRISAGLVRSYS
ncbi:hypothetical protein BDV27DRAFT_139548 [Aspergillus caelatus]|uniref:Uncharacterized protein n=1 Tax=Aspergillus caelatus TaxID=61420 RepID=A0A5N6ZIW1_9EURO|nr:uncharacterized protein BDV27DRAFT_139548 [Aspergillus caelatus]KAE8357318.1 hypothetical protein BDV27DRAFT_139548 [Aspergillus caelatus]